MCRTCTAKLQDDLIGGQEAEWELSTLDHRGLQAQNTQWGVQRSLSVSLFSSISLCQQRWCFSFMNWNYT